MDRRRIDLICCAGCCGLLAFLGASGCASSGPHEAHLGVAEGIAAATPPFFITGPASLLLTNVLDYNAHTEAPGAVEAVEGGSAISGNLFQQGGVLLFISMPGRSARLGAWAGSFRFLWDANRQSGYVISEWLQGYAPLNSPTRYTSIVSSGGLPTAPVERVDDQSCRSEQVTVAGADGSAQTFSACRPADFQGPPLRIISLSNTNLGVQLSQLNVEPQSPDFFALPDGSSRYSSAEAMVHEIIRRQKLLRFRPDFGGNRYHPPPP